MQFVQYQTTDTFYFYVHDQSRDNYLPLATPSIIISAQDPRSEELKTTTLNNYDDIH